MVKYCLYRPPSVDEQSPYFPAHKTHRDFLLEILEETNDECILILVFIGRIQDYYIPQLATII
jgi:hypothetical protein